MSRPSPMMSSTFFLGFKEAMGSWKIICIWVRRALLSVLEIFALMSMPLKTIFPAVGW